MKKFLQVSLGWALALSLQSSAYGQGTFRNLDFEEATLVPIPGDPGDPYGAVRFDAAFPGWTGYLGNQQATGTIPNGLPLSFSWDPFIVLATTNLSAVYQGRYMVCVSGGYGYIPSPNWTPASISQTGTIPEDAKSVRLLTSQPNVPGAGINLVFLDGIPITLFYLGLTANSIDIWGGDVSSFAGQSKELRLFGGWTFFDDITFSPVPIPEPSVYLLLLLGMVFLPWNRFGARSTNRSQ